MITLQYSESFNILAIRGKQFHHARYFNMHYGCSHSA